MGLSASQGRLLSLTSRMSDLERRSQSISNQKMRLTATSAEASQKYQQALNMEKITFNNGYNTVVATAQNLTEYNPNITTQRFLNTADGKLLVNGTVAKALNGCNGDLEAFLHGVGLTTDTVATVSGPENFTKNLNMSYDAGKITYYTNIFNEVMAKGGIPDGYATIPEDQKNSTDWLNTNLSSGNIYISSKEETSNMTQLSTRLNYKSDDLCINVEADDSYIAKAEAEYDAAMNEINAKEKRLDMELEQNSTEYSAVQQEMESVKKVMQKNVDRTFKLFG